MLTTCNYRVENDLANIAWMNSSGYDARATRTCQTPFVSGREETPKSSTAPATLSPLMAKPPAKSVELIERETPFQGYFRIDRYTLRHTLFAGGMSEPLTREVFERGHAAAILPYDPARDTVVLIEQFRIGAYAAGRDPWLIEVVAGIIDDGETARDVALRELDEEAGLTAEQLEPIGEVLLSPGGTSETLALFCARVDASNAEGIHGLADEHEDIRVAAMPFADAVATLDRGDIVSAPAVIALQWLALHRDQLRKRWRD